MLKPFMLVAAGVLLCASAAGTAQKGEAGAAVAGDSAARTLEIYERDCLVCQGANGDGKTDSLVLPDWMDPGSLTGKPDQQLFQIIRFGRGQMPAESVGRGDDEEVRDLIRYIRGMAKPPWRPRTST